MKKVLVTLSVFILSIVLTGCTESQISQYNELKEKNPELAQQLVDKYGEPTLDSTASADVEESNSQFDSTSKFVPQKNLQLNKSTSASISEGEVEEVGEEVEVEEVEVKPSYQELVIGEVAVGNTVFFGRYEQDNNLDNGPEAVEWRVLSIEDGKATLVPVTCMMMSQGPDCESISQEFYSDSFTSSEKELILEFHDLIDSNFLSKYAGEMYEDHYYTSSMLTCLTSYSSCVPLVASSGTTPSGDIQTAYFFWTDSSWSKWHDCTDGNHLIIELANKPRLTSKGWAGVNPYIVIETNNDSTLSVASVEAE